MKKMMMDMLKKAYKKFKENPIKSSILAMQSFKALKDKLKKSNDSKEEEMSPKEKIKFFSERQSVPRPEEVKQPSTPVKSAEEKKDKSSK